MSVKAALLGANTVAPEPAAGSTDARLPRWMACTRKSRPGVACAAARKLVVHVCGGEPARTPSANACKPLVFQTGVRSSFQPLSSLLQARSGAHHTQTSLASRNKR